MQESFTVKLNSIKIPKILSLLPLALIIGSCGANFENIEKFSLTSAVIQDSSAKMAKDIYQSCLRRAKYNTSEDFPDSVGISEIEDKKKECNKYQEAAKVVNNVNSVLIGYMVALGKLASDDTVSFENNLAALEASLKNLNTTLSSVSSSGGVGEEEKEAGIKIAKFIFNQLTTQFRQENLQEAILCTNQSIQEYTPGLNSIAKEFYAEGILQSEGFTIDSYYSKYVPTPEEKTQLVLYTFEQDYLTAVNALDEKKEAANAYVEIIQATAKTHQELFDEFNQPAMNETELEVLCQDYFAKDQDEQSNQTSSLSPKQLKRVDRIVMEYTDEIDPLVKKLDKAF